MISIIAAYAKNNELGYKGRLPWPRMAADKQRFHSLIKDKPIVMGMNTYGEYQHAKHAFTVEKVYVLTHQKIRLPDATAVSSIQQIVEHSRKNDIWAIGGASVYEQFIPYADEMYLTRIEGDFLADTFFPAYDQADWHIVQQQSFPADAGNPYPYSFIKQIRASEADLL